MLPSVRVLSFSLLSITKTRVCKVLKSYRSIHNVTLNDIPRVTISDIRKLLRQKGLSVQDGYTAITTKCPICSGEESNSESKIFINKITGYFICPKCSIHGEWNALERLLKKSKMDTTSKEIMDKALTDFEEHQKHWQHIVNSTTTLNKLNDKEIDDLFQLFEYPYHPDATKLLSEVHVNDDRTILYYPLFNSLNKVIGYRKIQAGMEEEAENHGLHVAGLFKSKAVKGNRFEQAVLVPTIQDLLHLAAHKVPGALIWLSNCTLPPTVLPVLESFPKLCLWGDWNNMRSVADKLGEERCRFVRPTDGLVTASEAAAADFSLKTMVANAKPAAHRSITTFAALRDDVYAELTNIDKIRGVKWRRYPALTRLLGGHRRGELTVLTGPTGCGKTTLCAEMSLDLAQQGVKTLWGSFEIRNSRLARTMLQQHAGVPLEQNLQDFERYADEFEKLPIFYLAFHGQQPIKVVMEAVEHARYMHDIAHVIVDNVQFMLGVGGGGGGGGAGEEGGGDRYWRQDAVIAAFRTFATARHCHVTLVMHPRKERESEDLSTSSIFGSAKASQEADNVLIIQDKRLTAVRGKKYLQVAKNRYSGDLGIVPLDFDKEALSYQAKKKIKSNKQGPPDSAEQSAENDSELDVKMEKHDLNKNSENEAIKQDVHVGYRSQNQIKNKDNINDDDSTYLRDILNVHTNR